MSKRKKASGVRYGCAPFAASYSVIPAPQGMKTPHSRQENISTPLLPSSLPILVPSDQTSAGVPYLPPSSCSSLSGYQWQRKSARTHTRTHTAHSLTHKPVHSPPCMQGFQANSSSVKIHTIRRKSKGLQSNDISIKQCTAMCNCTLPHLKTNKMNELVPCSYLWVQRLCHAAHANIAQFDFALKSDKHVAWLDV